MEEAIQLSESSIKCIQVPQIIDQIGENISFYEMSDIDIRRQKSLFLK